MRCQHCASPIAGNLPYGTPVDNGNAFAQVCPVCRHFVGIRPHLDTDIPAVSEMFSKKEYERLLFLRWRTRIYIQTHADTLYSIEGVMKNIFLRLTHDTKA